MPPPAARAKTQGVRADGARVDRFTRSSSFAEGELEDRTRSERRSERRVEPGCVRRRAPALRALTARPHKQPRSTQRLPRSRGGGAGSARPRQVATKIIVIKTIMQFGLCTDLPKAHTAFVNSTDPNRETPARTKTARFFDAVADAV